MQETDWNALKALLALGRSGTLTAAAAHLGVDETTVSRRVKALQQAVGLPLFARVDGRYQPTDVAAPVFAMAERFERDSTALAEQVARHNSVLAGRVRVSAVPFIVNHVLVPALHEMTSSAPDLTVELIAEPRNAALDRQEADIALRFARPAGGGLAVQAQRIGQIRFVAAAPVASEVEGWITYGPGQRDLPQATALEKLRGDASPALVVGDLETAIAAVAAGIGRSVLPATAVARDPAIREVPVEIDLPHRDVWLLTSRNQPMRAAVAAVKNWLLARDWR